MPKFRDDKGITGAGAMVVLACLIVFGAVTYAVLASRGPIVITEATPTPKPTAKPTPNPADAPVTVLEIPELRVKIHIPADVAGLSYVTNSAGTAAYLSSGTLSKAQAASSAADASSCDASPTRGPLGAVVQNGSGVGARITFQKTTVSCSWSPAVNKLQQTEQQEIYDSFTATATLY